MALSLSIEHNNPEKAIVIHISRTNRQQLHDGSDPTSKQAVSSLVDKQEQELKVEFFGFQKSQNLSRLEALGAELKA